MMNILYLHTVYRGNPTMLAPTPNPAPVRADTAIVGTYVSKMLKVAAAVNEIRATSSKFNERFGIAYAAMATMKPSTRYLTALFTSSPKSKASPKSAIIIINIKKKIYRVLKLKKKTSDNT